jgi:hypothetical protein
LFNRSEKAAIEPDEQPNIQPITAGHSDLYNAMIYPFTRMVITGAIWYQGKQKMIFLMSFIF